MKTIDIYISKEAVYNEVIKTAEYTGAKQATEALDKNGNPKDTRTPEQKKALLELLKRLKADYPNATIHGHREFAAKACPCFDAKAEYANL